MNEKQNLKDIFSVGILRENPVFVLLLALCPALGVTNTIQNGAGMGLTVLFVLVVSNIIISIFRKIIPKEIRIPIFITIIATVATILEMFIQAFLPDLFTALGIFLPLVVTNCVVFGRAEAFASKYPVVPSIVDGLGMGLGFLLSLSVLAFFREVIGTGAIQLLGMYLRIFPEQFAINLFIQPAGAFIVLGVIIGIMFSMKISNEEKVTARLKAEKLAAAGKGAK